MKKFQLLWGKKSNVSNPAWASIPPGDAQLMETRLTWIWNIQREVKSQRENMEPLESVNHCLVEYHPPSSTKLWGFRVPFYQRRQHSSLLYPLHSLPSQSANCCWVSEGWIMEGNQRQYGIMEGTQASLGGIPGLLC